MFYVYGVVIMLIASLFMLLGIQNLQANSTRSLFFLLLSAAFWAVSLLAAVNTEVVVDSGQVFVFKSPYLMLLNGLMMGTAIIIAALNYILGFRELAREI